MVSSASEHRLVVNASPLIYLAKLDALDVFGIGDPACITETVRREVIAPQAAYRFPEIALIDSSMRRGHIEVVTLGAQEASVARAFEDRVPGLGRGETETMALAVERGWPAVLHDRRARRVAQAFGVRVVSMLELVFDRTADDALLEVRIRRFASLVAMRIEVLEELLNQVKERSR